MTRALTCLALLALPLSLAACASAPGAYPSLAKREAERVSGTAQPAPPEVTLQALPPVAPDLEGRIAQLVAQARRAHEEFLARSDSTVRRVATAYGSSPPGDGWTEAQVALAGLQVLRSDAVIALAELDRLHAEERLAHPQEESPSAQAIATAREDVAAWVKSEDDVIAHLAAQLPG